MNQSDKDFMSHKLRLSIDLIQSNQPAAALREIADAVSVVAVALESSQPGPHRMTLQDFAGSEVGVAYHHHHTITTQDGDRFATGHGRADRGSVNHAAETRRIVEEAALEPVKPLCRSGLLAALSDGGKNPQCPACGMFHERRVVVVELSSLGLHMLKHEGAMRIGGGMDNPEKYRQDDRVIFTEIAAPLKGDVILGNVVKMFSGPYGREASIEVVKS